MKTRILESILWCSVMAVSLAGSAMAADTTLTLPEALDRALAGNPAIMSEQAEVQKQELGKDIASGMRLPKADLMGAYNHYSHPTMVYSIRQVGVFPPLDQDISSVGIALSLPVYAGGKLRAGESLASYKSEAASHKLRAASQDILFNVTTTYTKALHLRDLQQSAQARIKTLETEAMHIKQRLAEGRATNLELTRLQTQLYEARQDLLSIAQGERDALSILAVLLGETGKLSPLAGVGPTRVALPDTREAALVKARKLRPDLLWAQALNKAAAEQINIARGELRPQVNLVANVQESAGGDFDGDSDARIGIEVSFPLFDGSVRKNRVAQARFDQRKSELLIEETANKLVSDIDRALGAIVESRARLEVSRQGESEAGEALRIETARYQAGESTITDLLGAESALWSAQVSRLQAGYDVTASEARLLHAVGDLAPTSFVSQDTAFKGVADAVAVGGMVKHHRDHAILQQPIISHNPEFDLKKGAAQ